LSTLITTELVDVKAWNYSW